jgi:hypothetical protein
MALPKYGPDWDGEPSQATGLTMPTNSLTVINEDLLNTLKLLGTLSADGVTFEPDRLTDALHRAGYVVVEAGGPDETGPETDEARQARYEINAYNRIMQSEMAPTDDEWRALFNAVRYPDHGPEYDGDAPSHLMDSGILDWNAIYNNPYGQLLHDNGIVPSNPADYWHEGMDGPLPGTNFKNMALIASIMEEHIRNAINGSPQDGDRPREMRADLTIRQTINLDGESIAENVSEHIAEKLNVRYM